ncbi:MAG TPA: DUF3226 domain-containing protein [Acetobacteraceae bacterium]|nr:DUF3226 domain-containing protein [Acetobacteraceae bacterium]
MASLRSKQLLVEGQDDKFSVVGLMEHHVDWPDRPVEPPVYIESVGSVSEILKASFLRTTLKESGLAALGVMIDADVEPKARWDSFRSTCIHAFPGMPDTLPSAGLIAQNASGLRLGLWLMPDCSSSGMLVRHLVPEPDAPLWAHAESSFEAACRIGSPCRAAHSDKARIHTWLAWQDPPGESLGRALTRKTLDPNAKTAAAAFVAWFKQLYHL